jgi:hypothetical protein
MTIPGGDRHTADPRIRHALPDLRWPSQEEAACSRLFSPLAIGRGLVAADRTWVPAMVPWRASPDGAVTREVLDWYARFAEGQPGVLVVEATGIRDIPSGLDQRHKQVTCKRWDRLREPAETEPPPATDGRRRLLPPPWRPPAC